MRRGLITALLAASMTFALSAAAFAGTWQEDIQGMRYINDDGTYPSDEWVWIDNEGNGIETLYCFDDNGYLLTNYFAPDGRWTNENGEWSLEEGVCHRLTDGLTENAIANGYTNAKYAGVYYYVGRQEGDGEIFYYPQSMRSQIQLIVNDNDTITLYQHEAAYGSWETYKKVTDNLYQSIDNDFDSDLMLMEDGTVREKRGDFSFIYEKTDDPLWDAIT